MPRDVYTHTEADVGRYARLSAERDEPTYLEHDEYDANEERG